ncbi:MAG: long-chain fatty-acid-CoA ligase [Bacteriovoracaceae bacterium]|nr:long-chain fatty-acid-CoA ligase [Bacteriovoracaceae bacterium]
MRFGKTLPESFYQYYKSNSLSTAYYSKVNGKWIPTNFQEAFQFILKTIAGLKKINLKRGERIAILAENRLEWILTDYAAQWYGAAVAAIYITSSPDQIKYILDESESTVLFVSNETALQRVSGIKNLQTLKTVIAWDEISNPKVPEGIQFISRSEFLKNSITEDEAKNLLQILDPNEMSVLLYTSGTTGEPKGVILTHHNFISNLEMFYKAIPLPKTDLVTVSFLPFSHIYERVVHNYLLLSGVEIYFAESVDKLIENLSEARPHINTAVPRIFEKMYVKIKEKTKSASVIQKNIFALALWIGQKTAIYRRSNRSLPIHWKILYGISDVLVFRKIRAITGGRAQMFISGGAPLSQEIAEFFFNVGFVILEGYGLSETCILSVNLPEKIKFGTVGFPFEGVQIKFADDGEILVKGPTVMKGYYKRDDATTDVIDSSGWFHTGDIGELGLEGFLKITDRKKDLIVLAAGKKIAPQPIENILKGEPLIEAVCLVGDKRNYVAALITPNIEICKSWALSKDFVLSTADECAKSDRLHERIQRTIDELNATLPRYSTIKHFKILPLSFTIESGELTPTLKLKRRVIQEKYQSIIDLMYASTKGEGANL